MVLITGGRYQGKKEYAASHYQDLTAYTDYQEVVRRNLEQGIDPYQAVDQLLKEDHIVITMEELGCGVVPMDKFDIRYRECAGRIAAIIAQKADEVIRMYVGIPQKIK